MTDRYPVQEVQFNVGNSKHWRPEESEPFDFTEEDSSIVEEALPAYLTTHCRNYFRQTGHKIELPAPYRLHGRSYESADDILTRRGIKFSAFGPDRHRYGIIETELRRRAARILARCKEI